MWVEGRKEIRQTRGGRKFKWAIRSLRACQAASQFGKGRFIYESQGALTQSSYKFEALHGMKHHCFPEIIRLAVVDIRLDAIFTLTNSYIQNVYCSCTHMKQTHCL